MTSKDFSEVSLLIIAIVKLKPARNYHVLNNTLQDRKEDAKLCIINKKRNFHEKLLLNYKVLKEGEGKAKFMRNLPPSLC